MQFNGPMRKNPRTGYGEVGLIFVLVSETTDTGFPWPVDRDTYKCPCGKTHARIGIAYRRPRGMLGCWVQFQYNGQMHAPDLSVPISVEKYPLGTVMMSDEESSKYWHGE